MAGVFRWYCYLLVYAERSSESDKTLKLPIPSICVCTHAKGWCLFCCCCFTADLCSSKQLQLNIVRFSVCSRCHLTPCCRLLAPYGDPTGQKNLLFLPLSSQEDVLTQSTAAATAAAMATNIEGENVHRTKDRDEMETSRDGAMKG